MLHILDPIGLFYLCFFVVKSVFFSIKCGLFPLLLFCILKYSLQIAGVYRYLSVVLLSLACHSSENRTIKGGGLSVNDHIFSNHEEISIFNCFAFLYKRALFPISQRSV